ncbi:unnamed protein product [Aureobasidium vineae]|uniref:Uncharacterized protein n=1 Tax=Aureobasidium vineae TaxID=2773715 RepID=A0A9N8JPF0_9PEZI|nr:unnamed protein product [Aureobasidium vineae]
MASTVPAPKQFLWCDEHAEIATWLANHKFGMEFYGAFVNYCARAMDKWQRPGAVPLKRHLGHLHKTRLTKPLSGAAVLGEMKVFYERFSKTGDFSTGAFPLIELLDGPERIKSAHHHLYKKVFNRRVLTARSAPASTTLPAINGDTLAVVSGASAAFIQQPGLQGQHLLLDGPSPTPCRSASRLSLSPRWRSRCLVCLLLPPLPLSRRLVSMALSCFWVVRRRKILLRCRMRRRMKMMVWCCEADMKGEDGWGPDSRFVYTGQ